jgi:hypothetical protein
VLHVRVRLSLNNLLNLDPYCSQKVLHLLQTKKQEVQRHGVSPPFVEMHHLITEMEGE